MKLVLFDNDTELKELILSSSIAISSNLGQYFMRGKPRTVAKAVGFMEIRDAQSGIQTSKREINLKSAT